MEIQFEVHGYPSIRRMLKLGDDDVLWTYQERTDCKGRKYWDHIDEDTTVLLNAIVSLIRGGHCE